MESGEGATNESRECTLLASYSSFFLSTLFPLFDEVCFVSVPLVYTRRDGFRDGLEQGWIVEERFEKGEFDNFRSYIWYALIELSFFLSIERERKGKKGSDWVLLDGDERSSFWKRNVKLEEMVRKNRDGNDYTGFEDGPKVLKSFGFRENFRDGQKPRKLGLTHSKLLRFAALPRLSSFPCPSRFG